MTDALFCLREGVRLMQVPDHRPQYFLPRTANDSIFSWRDSHDRSTPTYKVVTVHRTTCDDQTPWIYEEKGWDE